MLEVKYSTQSLQFSGEDKALPVELFIKIMDQVQLDSSEDLCTCLDILSEDVKSSLNLDKVKTWNSLRHLLLEKYGKPDGFSILDCLHLFLSLVRKPEETLENYANRVTFCISAIEALNSTTPNTWQKILFLQGLQSPLSLVQAEVEFLLDEWDGFQEEEALSPKTIAKSEPLTDYPEPENVPVRSSLDKAEPTTRLEPSDSHNGDVDFDDEEDQKEDQDDPDYEENPKPKMARRTKKPRTKPVDKKTQTKIKSSIKEIDWDKPLFQQWILDKDYSDKVVVVCPLCVKNGKNEILPSVAAYKRHARVEHKRHKAACDICSFTCLTNVPMASHRFHVHKEITEDYPVMGKCTYEGCQYQYISNGEYNTHYASAHEKRYATKEHVCNTCGKFFNTTGKYTRHVMIEHEGITFKCEFCNKQYNSRKTLKYHTDREHLGLGHLHEAVCDICGHVVNAKHKLKEHIRNVHGKRVKKNMCNVCGMKFFSKDMLVRHERGVHQIGSDKLKCPYCERIMPSDWAWKIHVKRHQKKKDFHCKICNAWYTHPYTLSLHITIKHMGMSKEEGSKKDNIMAAKKHEAYEKIEQEIDPIEKIE